MSETRETIMQEYVQALDAIQENRARQVHVRPRIQPVPWWDRSGAPRGNGSSGRSRSA